MIKEIIIDYRSIAAIDKAERKKMQLENEGYYLVETVNLGVDKAKLIYKKD